jgi:hypothetical protein
MSGEAAPITTSAPAAHRVLRLRLKPKAPPIGSVDGAWWPRSRDLARELPALAQVLATRLGPVTRVAFPMKGWMAAPRRIAVDGRLIRLEGFHTQGEHILHVSGSDGQRITLLVVPPEAPAASGHDAMMLAAQRAGVDRSEDILAATGALLAGSVPQPRPAGDNANDRWANDGGPDRESQ